jgi:hypothetical protein
VIYINTTPQSPYQNGVRQLFGGHFRRHQPALDLVEKVNTRPKKWQGSEILVAIQTYAHAFG